MATFGARRDRAAAGGGVNGVWCGPVGDASQPLASVEDLLAALSLKHDVGDLVQHLRLAYQRLAEEARNAAAERQRLAEIEGSVELLRTISDVLDIRTVFPRVSNIARKMLPHDALAMVFVDQDRHFVRQAKSPDDFPDPPSVTVKTAEAPGSSSSRT